MKQQDKNFYGVYAEPLLTVQQNMLDELIQELGRIPQEEDGATPAEHLISRIKSAESMCEKLRKRGLPETPEAALSELSDTIGIRIVTHFVGDVYAVLEEIKQADCWEVVNVKDYIALPKPNGYRSLHVIVQLPFGNSEIPFIRGEIQLRTIAMDCWASLEHQMRYKKNIQDTALIQSELLRCAEEMASTDLTMQAIREMIQK
ncbi:MAG: hypothetical protein LUG91_01745 [Ruminococcus sp.]|nr:hypothetical protein [Ruminococcus sp.]